MKHQQPARGGQTTAICSKLTAVLQKKSDMGRPEKGFAGVALRGALEEQREPQKFL